MILDEDHHQLRTANGPENMAALTNLASSTHGTRATIASTTRSLSRQPKRAIKLLTQTPT